MGKQVVKVEKVDGVVKRQNNDDPPTVKEEHMGEGGQQIVDTPSIKKKRRCRIILRNLVVDINDKHLRKLCSPYGNIVDVSIPRHGVKNCGRGFAFIEFTNKNMCMKAIKQLNGLNYKGRTIIVDLAISKEVYEQVKEKHPEKGKKEEPMDVEPTQSVNAVEQPQKIVQEEMPNEQQDLMSTIFVRNLPYGVSESEVYSFFRKYGRIKFAKLVIDKETEQPKGTAFIKFRESEAAQKLIQFSRDSDQPQYARKELDPSISLEFQGRILKVFPAQSRQTLATKVEQREKPKQPKEDIKIKSIKKIKDIQTLMLTDKSNKRNLGLASEGICSAQDWMRKEDSQKFSQNQRQKLEKLKNPNNFVSPTRIILKYLDRTITELQLKDCCHEYIKEACQGRHKLLSYCKLMLDESRTKSIGIAFIEFTKSEAAVGFMRWVREKRQVLFPQRNSILIEFVIQDARKLQVIRKKIKKTKK